MRAARPCAEYGAPVDLAHACSLVVASNSRRKSNLFVESVLQVPFSTTYVWNSSDQEGAGADDWRVGTTGEDRYGG